MAFSRCGMVPVSFLPQTSARSGGCACTALKLRFQRRGAASVCPRRPRKRLDAGWKRLPKSSEVLLGGLACSPGVSHARGLCPLPILAEKGPRRSLRAAGERGLDRPGEADRGRGQSRGAAGRDRGADPGGHAGDRDFEPALYRERRALHDGDPDVRGRHRKSAHHRRDVHPGRPSPGDRALRRAEAVHAGGEQAGALLPRRASPAKRC